MFRTQAQSPDLLPILSRGKHRSPRKGACFMEMASCLAGERWSDHPKCTHPLLGAVARLVNDHTSDPRRSELVELVPAVIGLTTDDPRVNAQIALMCASQALPIVAAERQNVMAVSIMSAERVLARLEDREPEVSETSRRALEQAPMANDWAKRFARGSRTSVKAFCRYGAPTTVLCAVQGIAESCTCDTDDRLRALLEGSIAICTAARDAEMAAIAEAADTVEPPTTRRVEMHYRG